MREEVRRLAVDTFLRVGCAGLARVDFFVEDGARVLVNELNTLPGFTATSVYPKLWEATGLAFPELCDRLLGARGRALRGRALRRLLGGDFLEQPDLGDLGVGGALGASLVIQTR